MTSGSRLSFVDLFSGAGGLSLGLRSAGFEPALAVDTDRQALETYRRNLGEHTLLAKAEDLTVQSIEQVTGIPVGSYSLVAGGPPCQGFSVQRRGARKDSRNSLVREFARLALALRPQMILMENVPAIFGARGSDELTAMVAALDGAGYQHTRKILEAADYGVPQRRRRAFLVAWSPEVEGFAFPRATHSRDGWSTVEEALRGLPEPGESGALAVLANHVRVRSTPLNEARIALVPPGGGRRDLPVEMQLACHLRAGDHRHLDVFGRMQWDKPAPTITAVFDNFTRGRFAHPRDNRSITAREGARLQSFPDQFIFTGPKKDVARQVGNAVPPRLAYHLGVALRAALEGTVTPEESGRQLALAL